MRHLKNPTIAAGLIFFALLATALAFGPRLMSGPVGGATVAPVVVIK